MLWIVLRQWERRKSKSLRYDSNNAGYLALCLQSHPHRADEALVNWYVVLLNFSYIDNNEKVIVAK